MKTSTLLRRNNSYASTDRGGALSMCKPCRRRRFDMAVFTTFLDLVLELLVIYIITGNTFLMPQIFTNTKIKFCAFTTAKKIYTLNLRKKKFTEQ